MGSRHETLFQDLVVVQIALGVIEWAFAHLQGQCLVFEQPRPRLGAIQQEGQLNPRNG